MFVFLYPESYTKLGKVDSDYLSESENIKDCGHEIAIFNLSNLPKEDFSGFSGKKIIYRGFRLTLEEYRQLEQKLNEYGAEMFISTEEYHSTYYLPEWYETLKDLTPESWCFQNIKAAREFVSHNTGKSFFIKDFVKSLKTEASSIIENVEQFDTWLSDIEFFKGFIEGGICLRKIENFQNDTEMRFFVLNNNVYSMDNNTIVPDIVLEVVKRIDSKFYSVDVILNDKNEWRIVEISEGQVSSSKTWEYHNFAKIFNSFSF